MLEHYEEFFMELPKASQMPQRQRNLFLRGYLTGPAYSSVVKTLSSQAEFGKALYGLPILMPHVASINATRAVIRDCQDTSESGVQDIQTGRKETKGVPKTLVVSNLKTVGGSWRIVKIDYRGPRC